MRQSIYRELEKLERIHTAARQANARRHALSGAEVMRGLLRRYAIGLLPGESRAEALARAARHQHARTEEHSQRRPGNELKCRCADSALTSACAFATIRSFFGWNSFTLARHSSALAPDRATPVSPVPRADAGSHPARFSAARSQGNCLSSKATASAAVGPGAAHSVTVGGGRGIRARRARRAR